MKNKPLLICMTPVRNEAWVLHAFLKAASEWADYIIIADQMSTDGSREIALSYPKVILIENNNPNFNEAERQKILIERARKIEGDKILFGLDADEIFAANYSETADWKKILYSEPGEVFWFKWAEIRPDKISYWESEKTYYPWVFHDNGIEPHGNYVRNMHSMRIPYPIEEKQMYYVDDFRVLHLAYLNTERTNSKRRFYKITDFELNKWNAISLSRSYAQTKKESKVNNLPVNFMYNAAQHGFDLFEFVDCNSKKHWFDDAVIKKIGTLNIENIKKIDLWDSEFLKNYQILDPRSLIDKGIHFYLRNTQSIKSCLIMRIIDRILKKLYLFR